MSVPHRQPRPSAACPTPPCADSVRTRIATAGLAVLLLLPLRAIDPQLGSIEPPGVPRGVETELRFGGARLEDVQEVLFLGPGLTVTKLVEAKADHVTARLLAAPDCALGEHLVRLRAAGGLSTLRTLWVGPFPQTNEVEPNNEPAQAQKLPLNTTVNGHVANEDIDAFAVELKQGQRLAVELEGMRLGRGMFDPAFSVIGPDGRPLARSDDTPLLVQDPGLTLLAPRDGLYRVEVRESSFGGDGNPYRLHVGTFPRPTAVYPPGGPTGAVLNVRFLGDAAGVITQQVTLPPTPTPGDQRFGVFALENGVTSPSPNWMRVATFPNVLEAEPNDDAAHATTNGVALALPLAFNGIIEREGDVDWFRFRATKGQAWAVNVFARRIRSPLDPVLTIADAAGNPIASNDDADGPDSFLNFTAPADGEFTLKISDHLAHGGPDFVYRVEFAPVVPGLSVYLPDVARNDTQTRKTIVVARGNRYATLANLRRAQFGGDVAFTANGLPAGVTLAAEPVPGSQSAFPVLFEARGDAPVAGQWFELLARPAKPDANAPRLVGGVWQNYDLVQQGNEGVYYKTFADRIAVAVVDELPFRIDLVEPKAPLVRQGTLALKVTAQRKEGFKEPITVRLLFNPPGVGSPSEVTIPGDGTQAEFALNASGDAELRAWKIVALASAGVGGGTAYAASGWTALEVVEPLLLGKLEKASVFRGETTTVKCKLEKKRGFAGKADVRLLGLPPGTAAADRQITADDKEILFELTSTNSAPKGMHRSLFCSLSLQDHGEPISQTIAGGGTLRIDAPKEPKK